MRKPALFLVVLAFVVSGWIWKQAAIPKDINGDHAMEIDRFREEFNRELRKRELAKYELRDGDVRNGERKGGLRYKIIQWNEAGKQLLLIYDSDRRLKSVSLFGESDRLEKESEMYQLSRTLVKTVSPQLKKEDRDTLFDDLGLVDTTLSEEGKVNLGERKYLFKTDPVFSFIVNL
ncbi:hypothetical protein C8P63_10443 [Melghirimyces profundicolus]|uniref:Uncharacterized protein n=1 Tax=Melghirimyces profundicolus TaxID=1242148 RepID=A0A2T6C4E7_9BACL|nr:hypothetical protein [Melghirimyces profundicolus]PTX63199.1 hypothetical protein C8P63_10443 [Melghirimyces profundicolus]